MSEDRALEIVDMPDLDGAIERVSSLFFTYRTKEKTRCAGAYIMSALNNMKRPGFSEMFTNTVENVKGDVWQAVMYAFIWHLFFVVEETE